ncbi:MULTISPECIES: SRPBCC family protein [Myxococcus]|uniref:Polyketide cyclase n=1 Tax=Myxococcus xanthus TaxID=34 RepID=A0AAE6G413_MYXXA|nr:MULTISPECIES: SRPBCC family protein [Myxococcus]QDE70519.1 polyketide cyclase [Myxococcus xanthus]QDE77799.1 polyketide cyclase [Myxococcus xanthus]QDF07046.1 polyketide cyclase [Myxococcus xanthus]WAM24657.1 SRPBCC family protein [Myxococcus sp. NMCA1]
MIDVKRYLGAVVREVESREHEGKPARVVVATRDYDTTVEDLWDALTNPERIPRWFLPVSGDLKLGGRYELKGNASGTVTRCEAPRHLGLTWEFGGAVSWLEVILANAPGGGTRLRLEHMAHVSPFWDDYGPGATGVGWELGLMGLGMHLESGGAAVDSAAVEAWTTSDEGKAFITASSEGWGQADVTRGEDAAAAKARAARTTAFYTGAPPPDVRHPGT